MMRALKRRLSSIVYKTMLDDAITHAVAAKTGPGGQRGNDSDSSAAGSHPTPALRTSHFPDPPPPILEPHCRPPLDTEGSQERSHVGRPVASNKPILQVAASGLQD
jgi:transposase